MLNQQFLEANLPVLAHATLGKDLASATSTDRIKMDKSERLVLLVLLAAGAATTLKIQPKQHNAATGGTTKALNVRNITYVKKAGDVAFSQIVPTNLDGDVEVDVLALAGTVAAIVAVEILPEDLDVNGKFTHVSFDIPAAGAAKPATLLYVLKDTEQKPAYKVEL